MPRKYNHNSLRYKYLQTLKNYKKLSLFFEYAKRVNSRIL